MESPEAAEIPYAGLLSSILELTQEIENLEEQPLTGGPRKVLWAKKRFPRQGIRCVGPTQAKRRKYIGATARDFPWCILKKSSQTPNIHFCSLEPPETSEAFRRAGSTETRQETESSSSGRSPNAERAEFGNGTTETDSNIQTSGSADYGQNRNVGKAFNIDNCDAPIHNSIYVNSEKNENVVVVASRSGDTSIHQDENDVNVATAAAAVALEVSDDGNGTECMYKKHENNMIVDDKVKNDSSCSVVNDRIDNSISRTDGDELANENRINSDQVDTKKRICIDENCKGMKRGHTSGAATAVSTRDVSQGEIAPQRSQLGCRRSLRKPVARSKPTATGNARDSPAGKECFACGGSAATARRTSLQMESAPADLNSDSPQKTKSWTKDQWNDFFSVFIAVAAEIRTLQSLGSENVAANKRWLDCMRKLLQKPPF